MTGTSQAPGALDALGDPTRRARLAHLSHIHGDRDEATQVEITFSPEAGSTAVTLVDTGRERLEDAGPDLRGRNATAWSRVLPRFGAACGPEVRSTT